MLAASCAKSAAAGPELATTIQAWLQLLQAKHSLDKLFETLLLEVLKEKPADPLQYIIDSLSLGPEHAAQVC